MAHTEVEFLIAPLEPWRDILLAELGELGYTGFEEITGGLRAYIPSTGYDRTALEGLLTLNDPGVSVSFHARELAPRNWNAEWEAGFRPIRIGSQVWIRAAFHPPEPGYAHALTITPRMAFGTGHHATTRLMIQALLALDVRDASVCDLGCGTAVLAILAEQRGAARVHAIDIDQAAVENAIDNIAMNNCERIAVEKGDAALLRPLAFKVILANIERNTLQRDMAAMAAALLPGGALLLSGFIRDDADGMADAATAAGLHVVERMYEGEWALVGCRKP